LEKARNLRNFRVLLVWEDAGDPGGEWKGEARIGCVRKAENAWAPLFSLRCLEPVLGERMRFTKGTGEKRSVGGGLDGEVGQGVCAWDEVRRKGLLASAMFFFLEIGTATLGVQFLGRFRSCSSCVGE